MLLQKFEFCLLLKFEFCLLVELFCLLVLLLCLLFCLSMFFHPLCVNYYLPRSRFYAGGCCAVQPLPNAFLKRMEGILKNDFQNFMNCMDAPAVRGLRVNTLKVSAEQLEKLLPWPLAPSPFSAAGFVLPPEAEGLGLHPLHHAGAYYLQEPSAMSAVTALRPEPGERVLDLCAAPGGKSTQIAACLAGRGLLWSNEVVPGRVRVLLFNLERMGIRNAAVSSCRPDVLCRALSGFFDRVLVDAPCSGEGMFRKDARAAEEWSPAHVEACAARQKAILRSAADALRGGGVLVYSTCTFSRGERGRTLRLPG